MPPACGTITVLMDKGQKRFSAVGKALSSSYATLVSRVLLGGVFLFCGGDQDPCPRFARGRDPLLRARPAGVVRFARGPRAAIPGGSARPVPARRAVHEDLGLGDERAHRCFLAGPPGQGAARGLEIGCGCFGSCSRGDEQPVARRRPGHGHALGLHIAICPIGRFSVDALLGRGRSEGL